jgi:NDP-sugar pyrophosphorylase family protein
MRALVLAAGKGERARPLTDHLPKPLLPIANKPVMAYILEHLARHGFTDVLVNLHYCGDRIVEHFGDGSRYGVRLLYSWEEELLGSAGTVKRNRDFFGEETFLVIGADDLTDMDLTALLAHHVRVGAAASVGLAEVEETSQFGIVVTDQHGRIERFVEKPKADAPSNTANTQIYLFEPVIFDFIPPGQWYDFGYDVFPELVNHAEPFYGFALPGYWRDIGSVDDYLAAQQDVMEQRLQASPQGEQASPGLWVGEGCEIHPHARLTPPALIGPHCRIGAGAAVGDGTALAPGIVVPPSTSLSRCVVWEGARVPPGQELRGAVIGPEGVIAVALEAG